MFSRWSLDNRPLAVAYWENPNKRIKMLNATFIQAAIKHSYLCIVGDVNLFYTNITVKLQFEKL